MALSNRRYLAAMLASGAVAVAAVILLWFTAGRWYTPVVQAVGGLAGVAFAGLGLRWSFKHLGEVYGE
jgi:hypothetical protein